MRVRLLIRTERHDRSSNNENERIKSLVLVGVALSKHHSVFEFALRHGGETKNKLRSHRVGKVAKPGFRDENRGANLRYAL